MLGYFQLKDNFRSICAVGEKLGSWLDSVYRWGIEGLNCCGITGNIPYALHMYLSACVKKRYSCCHLYFL